MLHVLAIAFILLVLIPVAISAASYLLRDRSVPWRFADRSSAGLLPPPRRGVAVVHVFAARTVGWRGIVASHCWIVMKAADDATYRRFDYTAHMGRPLRAGRTMVRQSA